MKKIYTLILSLFLAAFSSYSQNLEETVEETHLSAVIGTAEAGQLKSHLSLTNNGSSDIEVRCRREIINQVPGSDERFCWGGFCYGNGTELSGLTYIMAPGETYEWDELGTTGFTGYYIANDNPGITQLKFTFFEEGNEANFTAVTIHYCVDVDGVCETLLSVEDNSKDELNLAFPNPANNNLEIAYSTNYNSKNSSIVIRNTLGLVVEQISTEQSNGKTRVDVSEYRSGIYTYSIVNSDQIMSTKSFIVSH